MNMKQPTGGDTPDTDSKDPVAKRRTTDGIATPHVVTADTRQRQRRKNWALLVVLVALSVLFYLITIVRMGNHG